MLRAEVLPEWEKVKSKFTSLERFKQKIIWETTEQGQPLPEEEIITRIQSRRTHLLHLQETLERERAKLEQLSTLIATEQWEELKARIRS